VRAIGEPDRRFREDKLRMMRAVRFAARFGFEIETETFRAVRRHGAEIHQVSPERLRDELTKMLTEGAARQAFELLDETWLLQQGHRADPCAGGQPHEVWSGPGDAGINAKEICTASAL